MKILVILYDGKSCVGWVEEITSISSADGDGCPNGGLDSIQTENYKGKGGYKHLTVK